MAQKASRRVIGQFPGFGKFTFLFFVYLYLPIIVVMVLSFNVSPAATVWGGFSLAWYGKALANADLRNAAWNSIQIAISAGLLSTILATFAATTLHRLAGRKDAALAQGVIMLPLVLPEIVMAVALLSFFSSLGVSLGKANLIIAHTLLCLPFAFLPIRARLQGMDASLTEAAADLYAHPFNRFRHVTLPMLMPGIVSGFMLAFVVSMDNFTVSLLVSQAGSTTLPVFIFGMLRVGVTPDVNAASTLIILASTALVVVSFLLAGRNPK